MDSYHIDIEAIISCCIFWWAVCYSFSVSNVYFREKKKYEAQIEKVVHMVQKKDREISSLKQVIIELKHVEKL